MNEIVEGAAPPDAPQPPEGRHRGLKRLLVFLIVMALLAGGVVLYVGNQTSGSAKGDPVAVTIVEGATASSIAAQLERRRVIRSAFLFRLLARLRGIAADLKPGSYKMRTDMSVQSVFDILAKGPEIKFVRLTIPEGRTIQEVAGIVASTLGIGKEEFLAAAGSGRYRSGILGERAHGLEGLLFPDTYFFKEDAKAADVIGRLLGEFDVKVAPLEIEPRAKALGITSFQAVVVASLVEDEAKIEADRPKIASVIYNRLRRGMRLEIDATVQYAIFIKTGVLKTSITEQDYKIDHPYNTYLISGLPPGAIASPGLAALRAALRPAQTNYLYYVLSTDGKTHCFAATYEEFLAYKNRRRSCV